MTKSNDCIMLSGYFENIVVCDLFIAFFQVITV
jgi:hypothetical protein